MKKAVLLFLTVVNVVLLGGCGSIKGHDVKIVIPAGSQEEFVYSEEEICPQKGYVTLASGEGLGDTEVVLEPSEAGAKYPEGAGNPCYLTPGMPVRTELEKDAWFRVGVSVQNPGDEDIVVYVNVKGADIRIK